MTSTSHRLATRARTWYGGYLGDPSDSIADPASRLNKDNYQLFEVGSLKFLMVSLEVGIRSTRWTGHRP